METKQTQFWKGEFGKNYTERNTYDPKEWNEFYKRVYGVTGYDAVSDFMIEQPKSYRILEVGCNLGLQLMNLQEIGFENLYGIELQKHVADIARKRTTNINIIEGNGFDIPFKDSFFDLVVTNGVLIHISPNDIPKFMSEIYRCSKKIIMGFEYYSENTIPVNYRGHNDYLWKADYAAIYLKQFTNLKLVKKKMFPYINAEEKGNTDCMFLLEKTTP